MGLAFVLYITNTSNLWFPLTNTPRCLSLGQIGPVKFTLACSGVKVAPIGVK